ncbi:MAG: T9SS type A sorting domain-containing protein, partial [Ignavibacteriales bacterium]|nr:T9SS type A sorting domain-containing protein [Ignavibacteriales bacterium]
MIRYELPTAANVTLRIFNTLGQVVASLVNERKEAGFYQATWNASTVPSGVYFYRLQAGDASTSSA